MKSPTRLKSLLKFLFLAMAALNSMAQQAVEIAAPQYHVGDKWSYQTTDNLTRVDPVRSSLEFVRKEGDTLTFKRTNLGNNETNMVTYTAGLQTCRRMDDFSPIVCENTLSFPLHVADKRSYSDFPGSNKQGSFSASCVNVGMERVTVMAGQFEAMKIECGGFWWSKPAFTGPFKEVVWYAPSVRRVVRREYQERDNRNTAHANFTTELVGFSPAKAD